MVANIRDSGSCDIGVALCMPRSPCTYHRFLGSVERGLESYISHSPFYLRSTWSYIFGYGGLPTKRIGGC